MKLLRNSAAETNLSTRARAVFGPWGTGPGEDEGGKVHTARSRNDQVITDVAMFTGAAARAAIAQLDVYMKTLVEAAERHLDWALPGYTHLQRAQPVYLSHHLLDEALRSSQSTLVASGKNEGNEPPRRLRALIWFRDPSKIGYWD